MTGEQVTGLRGSKFIVLNESVNRKQKTENSASRDINQLHRRKFLTNFLRCILFIVFHAKRCYL